MLHPPERPEVVPKKSRLVAGRGQLDTRVSPRVSALARVPISGSSDQTRSNTPPNGAWLTGMPSRGLLPEQSLDQLERTLRRADTAAHEGACVVAGLAARRRIGHPSA